MDNKILTYETLWSLVDIDNTEHKIKELASLFLEAMNDWPIGKQNIEDYILEFKKTFGCKISINGVTKNSHLIKDGWILESGQSITELIKISEYYYDESNFDLITEKIINFYNQEFKKVDFIAELKYHPIKKGNPISPIKSGYSPKLKFNFTKVELSGIQTFIGKEFVYPGEIVKAKIKIPCIKYYIGRLDEGLEFEFIEDEKIIGSGTIEYIVNEKLEKQ